MVPPSKLVAVQIPDNECQWRGVLVQDCGGTIEKKVCYHCLSDKLSTTHLHKWRFIFMLGVRHGEILLLLSTVDGIVLTCKCPHIRKLISWRETKGCMNIDLSPGGFCQSGFCDSGKSQWVWHGTEKLIKEMFHYYTIWHYVEIQGHASTEILKRLGTVR